jgi:murein DD-endopeptidase MepM/ murein hydrolase activator NlpD
VRASYKRDPPAAGPGSDVCDARDCRGVRPCLATPNPAFTQGAPIEDFIHATSSGDPVSGTFGAVRTNGRRFHEGIDIKPVMPRTRKGEPTDPVYAAMDGTVAHISTMSGKSNYGRYVVILHDMDGVEVYTLYAHPRLDSRRHPPRDGRQGGDGDCDARPQQLGLRDPEGPRARAF